jgi:glycogen phosphorylase
MRESLDALASNHLWTWQYRTADLLAALPTADPDRHPVLAVRSLDDAQLDALLGNDEFVAGVHAQRSALDAVTATTITDPDVVYFSPEFGISEVVPQYSGGLGILAGDHLKSASDLATSLGAVGLFYRHGFFRQYLADGQQAERIETYRATDFGCVDTRITVEVPIAGRTVYAKVWRFDVGRIQLLLLDTDVAGNSDHDRAITDQLYGGDRLHRLEQELVLGVGGARAVAAFGWKPAVYHSNEGHAGLPGVRTPRPGADRARQAVHPRGGRVGRDPAGAVHHPHPGSGRHRPLRPSDDRAAPHPLGRPVG